MNTPKAILIGFALVAAAVYFSRDVGPARAALGGPEFQISGSEGSLFKLNVDTGKVAWCVPDLDYTLRSDEMTRQAKIICSKFQ